jgi:CDP-diacylglycerol--glycerol-3-phosphate 3-phosphatidyltransferase
MNLSNFLTLVRIFLIPLLVVVLLTRVPNKEFIGAAIFLAAAVTDWLDGYFARKRREITALGTWLDPVADKLLVASAFIALVEMQLVPAWMVVIILGREFAVTGLRNVALALGTWLDPVADKLLVASAFIALVEMQLVPAWMVVIILGREFAVTGLRNVALAQGFVIAVSDLGKLKMVMQVFAITAIILSIRFEMLQTVGHWLLWVVVFFALLSGAQYFRQFWNKVDSPINWRQIGPSLFGFGKPRKGDLPTHQ